MSTEMIPYKEENLRYAEYVINGLSSEEAYAKVTGKELYVVDPYDAQKFHRRAEVQKLITTAISRSTLTSMCWEMMRDCEKINDPYYKVQAKLSVVDRLYKLKQLEPKKGVSVSNKMIVLNQSEAVDRVNRLKRAVEIRSEVKADMESMEPEDVPI